MHPIKNIFFLIGSTLYLVIFIGRRNGLYIPELINSYLTDFLMMPLVLMFTLWLTRIIKRDPKLVLSKYMIIAIFLYVSLVFEYLLPMKNTIYTSDWMDVVMYGFGGIVFWFLQKKIKGS